MNMLLCELVSHVQYDRMKNRKEVGLVQKINKVGLLFDEFVYVTIWSQMNMFNSLCE